MTKPATIFATAAVAVAGGLVALSAPASAQQNRIAEVIVYGNDPCPRSTDDEIVVCARKPEAERYRIPEPLRDAGPRQSRQAWINQARSLETVSNTGIQSCSAVGPGGHTGCLEKLIDYAMETRTSPGEEWVPPSPPPGE